MKGSQSVSKRRKSDYNSGCDRLSDLPVSIIHIILSSLPIEDAVRTSILSRQWRYTWTSLPKLEFISNAKGNQDENTASEQRLKEFISYALSVHKGSLQKFRLGGVFKERCPDMDEWLIRLSTKDIRELMLITGFHSFLLRVHSSIYSCNKLSCLHLLYCDVGPPPSTFKGFLFLKKLNLRRVKISNATFESLVSNSPILESLDFHQFTRDEKHSIIRVHAPNLKYLQLKGYWTEMSMNAPLLAEIGLVVLADIELQQVQRAPFCNYTNFLGGCTNLEKLIGLDQVTQVLSIGMESWNPNPPVFHRLRTIALDLEDFRDVKQQRVLARLLVGAPNLQILIILGVISSEIRDAHFSDFGFESDFRMEKLRFVEIGGVRGLLPEIKLIEFLLERSPLLETMSVLHIKGLGTKEHKDIRDKILGCTPASQTAKISVSVGKECY